MSAWQVKDKQWMEARKKEWRIIRENLETTLLKAKEIKQLEKYFLRGSGEEEVLLIFRLWFHPDDSVEHWQQMRADVTSSDFFASCLFFNQNVFSPSCLHEYMVDYGFMGGRERRILETLFAGVNADGYYYFDNHSGYDDVEKIEANRLALPFAFFTYNLRAWLCTDEPNQYSPIQYVVEQWYGTIREAIANSDYIELLKLVLVWVNQDLDLAKKLDAAFYDQLVLDFSDYRVATAQQLFDILETREFPSELVPVWQKLKQLAAE